MPRLHDTIAALATPLGTSAIAMLRVSGPDTLRLVTALAGRAPLPRVVTRLDYSDRSQAFLDEVLLTYFAGPKSYTGEDAAELTCHGNPFIAQKILEDLYARGCRPAEPGEFTQRAFLNGRMDLSQAEAVMDVIHARSERALAAAHDQLRGALGRRMGGLIDGLLAALAQIEAYIDFPDEDLPPENRDAVIRALEKLRIETDRLLATSHYGELLRDGIKTVIVGEPNVGKSSLLNRLVGRNRALVSAEPGTTRDFIEERIAVGPHCLRLIDTAGLNPSPAPLESMGMQLTRDRLEEADLILVVLDARAPARSLPPELEPLVTGDRALIVLNKSDLREGGDDAWAKNLSRPPLWFSALTGEGLEELVAAITARAGAFQTDVGADAVAINARHAHALRDATSALDRGIQKLRSNDAVELIASDLRTVLTAYGEITGKVDNERMLDQLFAAFCIGK